MTRTRLGLQSLSLTSNPNKEDKVGTGRHKIDTKPTVHKTLRPYNYKRLRRLSRMSGKPYKEVASLFSRLYKKLLEDLNAKKDESYLSDRQLDADMIEQLYQQAMTKLGIANEGLTNREQTSTQTSISVDKEFEDEVDNDTRLFSLSPKPTIKTDRSRSGQVYKSRYRARMASPTGIVIGGESLTSTSSLVLGYDNFGESLSRFQGFNIAKAETYLRDLGYSRTFVTSLTRNPTISLVHFPKWLNPEFKADFERFFERALLNRKDKVDHAVVFYARTVAEFVTKLFDRGDNPFNLGVREIRNLPISALALIYKYKFDAVLRYARSLKGFRICKFMDNKEKYSSMGKGRLSNFVGYGSILLESQTSTDEAIDALRLNKNLSSKIKAGTKIRFKSEKGVIVYIQRIADDIRLDYEIQIKSNFRYFSKTDIGRWIKETVVRPCIQPGLRIRSTVKNIT